MSQTEPSPPSPRLVRFGVFEVDLESGELRKNGLKIKLQEQPFQILAMLLERPGEVVTREELRQKLWSADTFVDFDHSLNAAVKKLRQALGDSADNPRLVETLTRRGYRFVALVEGTNRTVPSENAPPAVETLASSETQGVLADQQVGGEDPSVRKEGSQTTRWIWLVAAFGLMMAGSVWFYAYRYSSKSSNLPPMKVTRFTSDPGTEKDPALSPDGKQLAFVWDGQKGDNFDIYVHLMGAGKPLQLTTDPAADLSPAWSPDGRYIAFARVSEGSSHVYLIASLGGHERKLTELYSIWSEWKSLDWSPDGKLLAVAGKSSPEDPYSLFSISVDTGEKQKLTSPPVQFGGDTAPVFAPDGQTLAFTRVVADSDVYLLPLAGSQPKRLTFDNASYGSVWTPDGRTIIFFSDDGGSSKLWSVPISGGVPESLGISKHGIDGSFSQRANRLAYVEQIYDTDIWRIEVPDPQGRGSSPTKLISSSQWDDDPQYSPDGKKVVFGSNRSGRYDSWVCDSEGRNAVQLTSLPEARTGSACWSPDGRYLVLDSWGKGLSRIFVVSSEAGSPGRLTEKSADGFVPSWSKDNRSIYFCSNRSGSLQIWKMPAEGGKAVQVTMNGGFESFEAADGKTLYYSKLDWLDSTSGSARLWKVPVEGGNESLALSKAIYPRYWAVTDRGIYFVPSDWAASPAIEFFSFATGKVTKVVPLEQPPVRYAMPGLTVSPDGRWILCALLEQDTSDIMLVENFR